MFRIVTDTSANLPTDYLHAEQITVIPYTFQSGKGEQSCMDLTTFDAKDFYAQMRSGVKVTTSQIPPQRYIDVLTPLLEAGEDVLFVSMSSGISGAYQSAVMAARELREPLTNVMITADSLFPLCAAESSPRTAEQVARLNRGLFQILRIIGNMSDAERCAAVSHQETVDIPALFAEFFEKAETLVSHTGITLTYEGPDQPIYGLADREQLERAVLNILSNAIKFTPKGGTVTAKLTRSGRMLRLSVTDRHR